MERSLEEDPFAEEYLDDFALDPDDPADAEDSFSDTSRHHVVNYEPDDIGGMSQASESSGVAASGSRTPQQNHLFTFRATFHRKFYKNQQRAHEFCTKNVFGDSIDDIMRSLWVTVKPQINRKVEFVEEVPHWCDAESPGFSAMEEYVTLQDQSRRRTYVVSAITKRIMQTWRGRSIKIFVYVFSTNVETNAQHQLLVRTLLAPQNTDRSGAHSTRDDAKLADELKKRHVDLEGHFSSWLLWANFIHSAPAHEQEELKKSPAPPLQLSKYFRWAQVSETARLQALHRGMVVANTVNDGWTKDVAEMEKDLSTAMAILQSVFTRLMTMKAKGSAGSDWFTAMESALRPEESDLSRELSAKVTDCEDVDHV